MGVDQYGSGPDNAAISLTDGAGVDPSDGRLFVVDEMYPTGFTPSAEADSAGNRDSRAPRTTDGGSDGSAAGWRWVAEQSGSLYRFVTGGGAPQSSGNPSDGGTQLAATFTSGAPTWIGNAGGIGSGAPDGGSAALGETLSGGGNTSAANSGATATSNAQIGTAGGLVFNITFDSSVASAPAGFTAAINYVAQFFASNFSSPVTINLDVGWGEIAGQSLSSGSLGESQTYLNTYSYGQVRSALVANATSADQQTAVGTLPTTAPTGRTSFSIATAEAKALGLTGASGGVDGDVGFGSGYAYTFDPNNRAVGGQYDFIGVAAHEISEVMGRGTFLGEGLGYTALDLFRYSSTGTRQLTGGKAAYFSINGGSTNLDSFNTNSGGDYGDWSSTTGNDAADAFSNSGVANTFGSTDLRAMNVIGYKLAGSATPTTPSTPTTPTTPTPTTPTPPSPSATPYVAVLDTTTNQNVSAGGSAYSGPVTGLQYQYIYTGGDSVNITVTSDSWFLHGGPGGDAIHAFGGYNVLDGGAGSNFLTGGNGTDTFYVDNRNPGGDIWSTVNGFHAGDDATVFGIVPNGSNIQWFDNQGAAGYTGLTLHVPAPNAPTASLTLSGYSSSDLSNGRLNVSFGNETDGTPYMHIIAS